MISDSVFKKSSFSSRLYNISICMLVQYLIQLQLILPLGANSNKGARISNGLFINLTFSQSWQLCTYNVELYSQA